MSVNKYVCKLLFVLFCVFFICLSDFCLSRSLLICFGPMDKMILSKYKICVMVLTHLLIIQPLLECRLFILKNSGCAILQTYSLISCLLVCYLICQLLCSFRQFVLVLQRQTEHESRLWIHFVHLIIAFDNKYRQYSMF